MNTNIKLRFRFSDLRFGNKKFSYILYLWSTKKFVGDLRRMKHVVDFENQNMLLGI